jgi:hypothetical protein
MDGPAPSLAAFEGVLHALNEGRAATHTAQDQYLESRWPVIDAEGRQIELVWPDYGGEQIRIIREQRSMSPEWHGRISESDSWIVMVRICRTETSDDIFTRPIAKIAEMPNTTTDFLMSPQARLVEFLQWLMYVRGTGTLDLVSQPRLMVLLSCWDELPESQNSLAPARVLEERMPLVAAFLKANWKSNSLHVLGLSALERSLSEDEVDEEYIELGPEMFGYIVEPDGGRSKDLTCALLPLV